MVLEHEMMKVLLDACPSFLPTWKVFEEEWKGDFYPPLYVALGDFAQHLIDLLHRGAVAEFSPTFEAIEFLIVNGEEYVRDAVSIGILETLQNEDLHNNTTPDQFRALLLPESVKRWDDLYAL